MNKIIQDENVNYTMGSYDTWVSTLLRIYPDMKFDNEFMDNHLVFRNMVIRKLERMNKENE